MHYLALLKEVYCKYIRHLDMIYTISHHRYICSLFTGCSFNTLVSKVKFLFILTFCVFSVCQKNYQQR